MNTEERQQQLRDVLGQFSLPSGINIRAWSEGDFPAIQRISEALGWPSPTMRPDDSLFAWQHSWPALVAVEGEGVVGFVRALTDGAITMYIAELALDEQVRGRGIGRALLDVCHALYPKPDVGQCVIDTAVFSSWARKSFHKQVYTIQ